MERPDIFLSYNREDAARAKHFADGFAAEGLDVWWDVELRSGEAYDEVTENALHEAKAVVVLWSPRSVVSRWVRSEATIADQNKTLVPAMIEPCRRPVMFELVQTAELSHWQGDAADPAWQGFVAHVRNVLGKPAPAMATANKPATIAQTSVVVLPFENMSRDEDQEYFSDGITEDIITDLSKVSALLVIARNTAFTFKGKHVDIKEVARQLEVTHVLEGSVRKAGNRIRVTAQLIDGATGGHVWAERYDRELEDIFDIQDEISEAIVGALKLKLMPAEKRAIEERLTVSAEAYDHYLRARALRATMNEGNILQAVEAYRKALALDPEFAKAWAGLASVLLNVRSLFGHKDEATPKEIDSALKRARELAPDLPDITASLSQVYLHEWNWDGMEQCIVEFQRSKENSWTAFSTTLGVLGRAQEAVEQQYRVRRDDPLSVGASWGLQYQLGCAGRLDEADQEYARASSLLGRHFAFDWQACLRQMARRDHEGLRQLYSADFSDRQPFAPRLLAAFDDTPKALAIVRELLDDPQSNSPFHLSGVAHWAAYFGDEDLALDALTNGNALLQSFMITDIWQPNFAGLRQNPRFKQILIDIGLADHWRKTGNWGDFARPVGDDDFEIIA